MQRCDAVCFEMPSLEEELTGERLRQKNEEIERQAYNEGFATGEKAGFAAGEQKAVILMDRLQRMLEEITAFRNELVSSLEPQVVGIALAVARKIIFEDVRTHPEVIVTMVREALKKLQRVGEITIRINPALHEIFKKNKPQLLEIHPDIVFEVNSNIPVTAPLVISAIEEVVTDLDSLLDNVVKEMAAVRPQAAGHGKKMAEGGPASDAAARQQALKPPPASPA